MILIRCCGSLAVQFIVSPLLTSAIVIVSISYKYKYNMRGLCQSAIVHHYTQLYSAILSYNQLYSSATSGHRPALQLFGSTN